MIIHVVQEGETLQYIADKYQVPATRLIQENGITNPNKLVTGQTIVIVNPLVTYNVEQGETLAGIAAKNNISVIQLLRNNPYLSDREVLYPGETLVISYDTKKIRQIAVSGYTYPFISKDVLKKTLPFLTYLTVFNYRVTSEGDIIDIDDADIVSMAKEYGVAPIMLVSTLSERGIGSSETANSIISNPEVQDKLFDNVIKKLKEKGYYGINIYLQYLRPENRELVESYMERFSQRLHAEGFRMLVTVTPRTNIEGPQITYERIDYTRLSGFVDGMLFLSYDWAYSFGPPASVTPLNIVKDIMNYVVTVVPPEKVFLGFPVIGYDWELPYIPGYTMARAITYDIAIELAVISGVPIKYNEISQAPYYYYTNETQALHIVWFKDSRSINALAQLVPDYNLQGLSVWNIMRFFAQMWFILNTQYEIERVDNVNKPFETKEPASTQ